MDCCIVLLKKKYVNLACFLNICILWYLYALVESKHTAPLRAFVKKCVVSIRQLFERIDKFELTLKMNKDT